MSLQEDELEFSNEKFRAVYHHVMSYLQANEVFNKEKFISETPQELVSEITDLYMSEEKYRLDKWESKNIFPRTKDQDLVILQNVNETILNFRCYLLYQLIGDLMNQLKGKDSQTDNSEALSEIVHYGELRKFLFSLLGNVTPLNHFSQYN